MSAGVANVLRAGVNFGIAFGFEVREGQRGVIEAGELGVPLAMRNAAQRPLLLYDSGAHCAWLVPELSVALDMAHFVVVNHQITLLHRRYIRSYRWQPSPDAFCSQRIRSPMVARSAPETAR